jgi:DNA polymerase elongation subunit (family B)
MTTEGNICMNLVVLDTDSNYIQFPHLTNATETWDYALEVADKISGLFPDPIRLEFEEEIYAFFLILSKKRYMYRKCLRDGVVDDKIGKKGVLLARRDNSKFVRDVYEGVVSMIASHKEYSNILYFVIDQINQMCCGIKPYTDFIVTKSIGNHGQLVAYPIKDKPGKAMVGDYTVPLLSRDKAEREEQMKKKGATTTQEFYLLCLPAQVQLAERMRRRGKRVDPGTRLEYVVTNPDKHTAKQYEKIESAEYMNRHRDIIRIDYMYYLKALVNPLDQVLDVAFKNEKNFKAGFTMEQYKFRWKIRNKMIQEIKTLSAPNIVFH